MAKIQMLPDITLGDRVHYACHWLIAGHQRDFDTSMREESLGALLDGDDWRLSDRCPSLPTSRTSWKLSTMLSRAMRILDRPTVLKHSHFTGKEAQNLMQSGFLIRSRKMYFAPRYPPKSCYSHGMGLMAKLLLLDLTRHVPS
jgi:hypothetical protein